MRISALPARYFRRVRPVLIGTCLLLGVTAGCRDSTGPGSRVATVEVSGPTDAQGRVAVEPGATVQLTAVARNASGQVLAGKSFTWRSSDERVAVVTPDGVVAGVAAGTATVTAEAEGKRGAVSVTVLPEVVATPTVSRVSVTPGFATVDVGGSTGLRATALTAGGDTVRGLPVEWSSSESGVVRVDAAGAATGAAVGVAGVVARVDEAVDTAVVAVLGSRSLLSTAFPGGAVRAAAKPGATVAVPVTLDMSRVSPTGDLGTAQLEVAFDTAVLRYDSARAGVAGAADVHQPTPGVVRFAFANNSGPQGSAELTLVTLYFRVASGAPAGAVRALALRHTEAPRATDFSAYSLPLAVGGRIRVESP